MSKEEQKQPGNKQTVALTKEQYKEIITTIRTGFTGLRPNERIATALTLEANLGLRISDILRLRLKDIVFDGGRYRLAFKEKKTTKDRTFTVPLTIYQYIENYCLKNNIKADEVIFPITTRAVQKHLKAVCEYLGYDNSNIGTHSFRKFFATEIYNNNEHDVQLVSHLLQHSSTAITRRYIKIDDDKVEQAISNHICLL